MKKLFLYSAVLLTITCTTITSCTKTPSAIPVADDKGGLNNTGNSSNDRRSNTQPEDSSKTSGSDDSTKGGSTTNVAIPGTWKVTYYHNKKKEETSNYAGYSFAFNNDGTLTATQNGKTVNGTWKVINDSDIKKFIISLAVTTKPLSELNDDWMLITMDDVSIKLGDKDPSKNEQLIFSKQ